MVNITLNRQVLLENIKKQHQKSNYYKNMLPKLVAVSKKQEEYKINLAIKSGQIHFGENRVQEAENRWKNKLSNFKDLQLRLIGPLQTNKVKQALNLFDIIETIDREKLAIAICNNFNNNVKTKGFYIQVNTGNEPQKGGVLTQEADPFIKYCLFDLKLPILGLMCIPPYNEEPSMHFSLLKKIGDRNNLKEFSMGMSNDYMEAVKFGSTSVRVGTLFFGQRKD